MEKINILVLGVIGSGKSTFLNNILELKDDKQLEVDNGVVSVTRITKQINFSKNGRDYNFYDTRGMGEPTEVDKIKDEALVQLIEFIHKVCQNGIQIIIFLIKGRLTEESLRYYYVFFILYIKLEIPFLIINTGEDSFLKSNLDNNLAIKQRIEFNTIFYKKNLMFFENVVLTSFPMMDPNDQNLFNYYKEVIQYSKNAAWDAIELIANKNKNIIINPEIKLKKTWSLFNYFFIFYSFFRKNDLKKVLIKNGVDHKTIALIDQIINNINFNVKEVNFLESTMGIQEYKKSEIQKYIMDEYIQTISQQQLIKSNWLFSLLVYMKEKCSKR